MACLFAHLAVNRRHTYPIAIGRRSPDSLLRAIRLSPNRIGRISLGHPARRSKLTNSVIASTSGCIGPPKPTKSLRWSGLNHPPTPPEKSESPAGPRMLLSARPPLMPGPANSEGSLDGHLEDVFSSGASGSD